MRATKKVLLLPTLSVFVVLSIAIGAAQDFLSATTTREIAVYASPPRQGFLLIQPPGRKIDTLAKGTSVRIDSNSTVTIKTVGGQFRWVKIEYGNPPREGWTLNEENNQPNFR
jgi:hypothetical protein